MENIELEKAAFEYAVSHSKAPDKETPDWIITDFKAGAQWQQSQQPEIPEGKELFEWVKASVELPKEKGYYITRRPPIIGNHWLIKEATFNPKYDDTYIHQWANFGIEWLKPVKAKEPIIETEYKANFLWGFPDDSIESIGYEVVNAKTEDYRKECWNELIQKVKAKEQQGNEGIKSY